MRIVTILLNCLLVAGNIQHKHGAERLFDKQKYEVRSCLSSDLEDHEISTCRFHAIIIDAGSTGTRVHIFEFSHTTEQLGAPFILQKETFHEVKPGLSDFADRPKEAGASVSLLVQKAISTIPANMHANTPVALKATAGLRLLPDDKADKILDEVDKVLSKSPFLVNDDSVSMLSGTDEGIFGWFTLNYLLNRIDAVLLPREELTEHMKTKWTAVALDLGGGSTQVTMHPLKEESLFDSPANYLHTVRMFGNDVILYSHSYLGNGLVATRLSTLQLSSMSNSTQTQILVTPCMPDAWNFNWAYAGYSWHVSGTQEYSFAECQKVVKKFVRESNIHYIAELKNRVIYAFSYFYDRGFQTGLVPETTGGFVTPNMFLSAAQKACLQSDKDFTTKGEHWRPWQCLDLTYIHTLLTDGYKLDEDTEIYLAKKLRGNMETSWALGAAYHLLNTYHEQKHGSEKIPISSSAAVFANRSLTYVCNTVYQGVNSILSYFQLLA